MKKLILLFAFLISIQSGYCASEKMDAIRSLDASFKAQNQICLNVSRNFKEDAQLSNFIKNECVLYQMRRQRTLPLIFPMTSNNGAEYKANYRTLMAEYAYQMDKEQIENIKKITTEYCKYNNFRFVKKDPTACTRVNNLFVEF